MPIFEEGQRVRYIEDEQYGIDGPPVLGVIVNDQDIDGEFAVLFDGEEYAEYINSEYLALEGKE